MHEDIIKRLIYARTLMNEMILSDGTKAIYKRTHRAHNRKCKISQEDYISMAWINGMRTSQAVEMWTEHFGNKESIKI